MTLLEALPEIIKGREWRFKYDPLNGSWLHQDSFILPRDLEREVTLKPRKVKKELKVWVNVYESYYSSHISAQDAEKVALQIKPLTAAVECTD